MDTQKLYRVASDIINEFTVNDISGHLTNLTTYIGQNTTAGFDSAKEITATLGTAYEKSVTNQYAPTYLEIVEQLGATNYVGNSGKVALDRVLNSSPLNLVSSLQEYVTSFNLLVPKLKKLIDSLNEIGVEPYEFDLFEIGYVIPAELNDLADITKRLTHYNKFIALSSTIAGEKDNTVHLSRVSNGSIELFVLSGVGVVRVVDTVLKRIISLYQEVLKIKKIRADIEKVDADTLKTKAEALANLVAMEKEYSEKFVGETVDDLLTDYNGSQDLKDEIGVQLGVTIKLLLKDIQSGIKVEVTPPEVEGTEEGTTDKTTDAVLASIASTNTDLIRLYSLPKEDLHLPSGIKVTKDDEKKLEKEIKLPKTPEPKTPVSDGGEKTPETNSK
jgi:hypothetical protein